KNLYILRVSELIYMVPDGEVVLTSDAMYSREYYTIAEKKKEGKYKDIFQLRTFKDNTQVGFGVIRDVEDSISIDELTGFTKHTMTKKEALVALKNYLVTLNPEEDIEISAPKRYTKDLNLDLRPQTNK
ncbi:MAG: hypothetical protein K2H20_02425, partial [Bacilli bacterium]|nr:hypothetical protein [Bacilli bacterium]